MLHTLGRYAAACAMLGLSALALPALALPDQPAAGPAGTSADESDAKARLDALHALFGPGEVRLMYGQRLVPLERVQDLRVYQTVDNEEQPRSELLARVGREYLSLQGAIGEDSHLTPEQAIEALHASPAALFFADPGWIPPTEPLHEKVVDRADWASRLAAARTEVAADRAETFYRIAERYRRKALGEIKLIQHLPKTPGWVDVDKRYAHYGRDILEVYDVLRSGDGPAIRAELLKRLYHDWDRTQAGQAALVAAMGLVEGHEAIRLVEWGGALLTVRAGLFAGKPISTSRGSYRPWVLRQPEHEAHAGFQREKILLDHHSGGSKGMGSFRGDAEVEALPDALLSPEHGGQVPYRTAAAAARVSLLGGEPAVFSGKLAGASRTDRLIVPPRHIVDVFAEDGVFHVWLVGEAEPWTFSHLETGAGLPLSPSDPRFASSASQRTRSEGSWDRDERDRFDRLAALRARVRAIGWTKDKLRFEGAVVGGGRFEPLEVDLRQVHDIHDLGGHWEVSLGQGEETFGFRELHVQGQPVPHGGTDALTEPLALTGEERDRRARLDALRPVFPVPREGDIEGKPTGAAPDDPIVKVSSVHLRDVHRSSAEREWTLVTTAATHKLSFDEFRLGDTPLTSPHGGPRDPVRQSRKHRR